MSQSVLELSQKLQLVIDRSSGRPTQEDRLDVLGVIKAIKNRPENLSDQEEADYLAILLLATSEANRQEDFYNHNGNKWAD